MSELLSRELPITNKRGLHARASAKFVQTVEKFNADITVTRNGETVGGTSIMGLMMLGAAKGDSVELTVSGAGGEVDAIMAQLAGMIRDGFGEE